MFSQDPRYYLLVHPNHLIVKKYSITVQEHPEYGGLGLVVDTGRDYFEPLDGYVVAHDILDHTVNPHSCAYTDELMAIGGFIARSLNSADFYSSELIGLSNSIQSLFTAALYEDCEDNAFTEIETCSSYLKDSYIVNKIKNVVKNSIIEAYNEWADGEVEEQRINQYDIDSIVGWICKGYQLFKKRFVNVDHYHLFHSIRKECDIFLLDSFEGQSATLHVNFVSGHVYIKTV